MSDKKFNYYLEQIQRVLKNHDFAYHLSIQIIGTGAATKSMALTPECLKIIHSELTSRKLNALAKRRKQNA